MRHLAIFIALAALVAAEDAQAGRRRALLVGINDYTAATAAQAGGRRAVGLAPPPDRDWRDLTGAVNDVALMREMLVLLYGFDARDIVTLTDQRATRAAILRTIEQHLVKPVQTDDVVLFYFAGHGSQVRNSRSDEPDRMDESLVPADSRAGARDIRDKELRALFSAMLDKGARLTVILDNCHSGSGARGLPTGARPRSVEPDPRDVADGGTPAPRPEDRGALVLSAAQDFDQAWETRDEAGRFHGAFSWALIRAMRDSSPGESAGEVFLRARARMRAETPFQEPVLGSNAEALRSPFLGDRAGGLGEGKAVFVEKVRRDGTVLLQGGWAHGLTVGTELRVVSDPPIAPRLRLTAMIGVGRSEARVEPGHAVPRTVKSGAMLEVTRWAAPPGRPLRVWTPRASRTAEALAALARRLHADSLRRGVRWISDPVELAPLHLLRRGSREWELLGPAGGIARLGQDPAAAVARLPAGASLFVQFPAPAAWIDGMGIAREGIALADRPEEADYVLLARYASRRLEYAWVRPAIATSDKRMSGLPLRTEWVAADGRGAAKLRDAVLRLRRIHAWYRLESPPDQRSPYRLALRRAGDGELAKDVLVADGRYDVVLRSLAPPSPRVRQRYVYVFVIDSHGNGILLFPRSGSVENRLPIALPAPPEIRLGSAGAFAVAPPYGVDTWFLLTTDEPLPNPWILNWDGVRTRAPRSPAALEQLLTLAGSPSRHGPLVAPSSWSLERVVYESVPPRPSASLRR
ncbi:MAG TPA: caspase family protein [Thermoanaerobaculia bacterium]|nr:caspase family protein [Thermoanaerobaculia bacterium]